MNQKTYITPIQFPKNLDVYVILVAAGMGTRMGLNKGAQDFTPKQYRNCGGLPVLCHSLVKLARVVPCERIVTVINPCNRAYYDSSIKLIPEEIANKLAEPVNGGPTRQESVRNALDYITNTFHPAVNSLIIVHDAARPCVALGDILSVIGAAEESGAASLCSSIAHSLREKDHTASTLSLGKLIDRDEVLVLETPQVARFDLLHAAYQKYEATLHEFTDDTCLISALPHTVRAVMSSSPNPKITYLLDLDYANFLLSKEESGVTIPSKSTVTKSAMGYDVHAFGDISSSIIMGGISIPHTHMLKGHSDADVVLHAITDAILGLIGVGDIGTHFPPSDITNRGRNSRDFLEYAHKLLRNASVDLCHIDVTIVCEAPKIGPYREAMRANIAEILSLGIHQVAVKATTSEGLGFTGRKEGVAAFALATAAFLHS